MCDTMAKLILKYDSISVLFVFTDSDILNSLPSINNFVTFMAYTANELINLREGKGYLTKRAFMIALAGTIFNGLQIVGVNLDWITVIIWKPAYYYVSTALFIFLLLIYLQRLFMIFRDMLRN